MRRSLIWLLLLSLCCWRSEAQEREQVSEVDGEQVLRELMELPISRWRFPNASGVEHIGPQASDFHRTFGVGASDNYIATIDADGVLMAAIQGLYRSLERQQAELAALRTECRAARAGAASRAGVSEPEGG